MNEPISHSGFQPLEPNALHALAESLREAATATGALVSQVIGNACWRTRALPRSNTRHIERLIEARAWTDVALALLKLELPQWQIRRIAYDDGEWHCALSRQRGLPEWLDQSIEAHHAEFPLAILSALVEARCVVTSFDCDSGPIAFDRDKQLDAPLCCDNFS
jgi:hypothetical protein